MIAQKTLQKHADLMDRMASSQGIDLEEQALRGAVSIDQITDAVLSCTNCTNPEACNAWLDKSKQQSASTPSFCRNRDLFAALK